MDFEFLVDKDRVPLPLLEPDDDDAAAAAAVEGGPLSWSAGKSAPFTLFKSREVLMLFRACCRFA